MREAERCSFLGNTSLKGSNVPDERSAPRRLRRTRSSRQTQPRPFVTLLITLLLTLLITLLLPPLLMAVSVSSDLMVRVQEDANLTKITARKQSLRESLQKGEPKSLGVSQVMLGLLVMTYSFPLSFTMSSEVLNTGTPWWSGVVFITAGVTAIMTEKHCSIKSLRVCLLVTLVSVLVSLAAVVVYITDLVNNPDVPCGQTKVGQCDDHYYDVKLSRGVKSSLFLFTLTQTAVSSTFCFLLYRVKHTFAQYTTVTHQDLDTPTSAMPPD